MITYAACRICIYTLGYGDKYHIFSTDFLSDFEPCGLYTDVANP